MALPSTIDPSTPAGGEALSLGDDRIRAFKQAVIDIFGLPSATPITAAYFSGSANGLDGVLLGAGTLAAPAVRARADTNTGLSFLAGDTVTLSGGGNETATFVGQTTAVNFLTVLASLTGVGVTVGAVGDDTNIPLILTPKGASGVKINATISGTPEVSSLYAKNIVKGYGRAIISGGAYTLGASTSFNVTSITDGGGTGIFTITWDRDFANTNYIVLGNVFGSTAAMVAQNTTAVGSTEMRVFDAAGSLVDTSVTFLAIGDQ